MTPRTASAGISGAAGPSRGERPLHVLVVDDSAVVRQTLSSLFALEGIEATVAADPYIAMEKMSRQRPDVIVLDLELPRMHGLDFLARIMETDPVPVVVCSALTGDGTDAAMRALEQGALAVVTKPKLNIREFLHESAVLFMDAVRGAAQARVAPRRPAASPRLTADAVLPLRPGPGAGSPADRIVVIGASTGGTEALSVLLQAMPHDGPGMVVVQHMPEGFTAAFAARLHGLCRIDVKEAAHGDRVRTGLALVAPGNRHALVRRRGDAYEIELSDGPLVSRHRPSVDVLFRSAAQAAGRGAIGVLMTGMGDDGARGLLEMKEAGAATLAQDEASCVVFGMPREAIARGAVDEVVALDRLAAAILKRAARAASAAAGGRA
ncbi:MAG TPA: chemotaxis response regulator protein-glutamate methylesterase [Thermoanaerobaculia bacterium]|jgi:two-component system chemotaxis response regulator CheB|nr:chemotaxis response regulator protein-glutamate methylesterase [Thermoanaerobaculia bacterium]